MIYPYLLKDKEIKAKNQVQGIDITYIRLKTGWVYLVAIIDWYSRYVVSWEIDETIETEFVIRAGRQGINKEKPEILNSDQDAQFTSKEYIEELNKKGIKISMDGKGRAIDNVFTERFWRSIKYEDIYLKEYETPRDSRKEIEKYIKFYNKKKITSVIRIKNRGRGTFKMFLIIIKNRNRN